MAPRALARAARWLNEKVNGRPRAVYGAATTGRMAEDWMAQILSADAEMRHVLATLRARSRQLVRDNAHAAGFIHALVDGVLGEHAVGVRPRVRRPDGALDDATNGVLWDAWCQWQHRETCSADGQNSFAELQRLIFRAWATDGEVLVRRGFGAPNAFGYDLQVIDADLLDETLNVPPAPGRNEIRMGIEVDRRGRPVAYHLFERHPHDMFFAAARERVRVPAEQILHLFLQLRPGQTRGVPLLTPVMLALRLLDEYTIAELMMARVASSAGGFFETDKDAYTPSADAPDGTDASRAIRLDLEPGVSQQLPPGITFKAWDPKHPTDAFEPFQKVLLRMVARGSGSGVSYATLTGDLSEANYSSDRAGRLAERDAWRASQRWFADRLLRPVYGDVVRFGLLAGAIALPLADVQRLGAHDFEYRGWPWVDPLKDINAAGQELALRLTSRQRVCAERGRDFETILEELAEEERLAGKYGVPLAPTEAPRGAAPATQTALQVGDRVRVRDGMAHDAMTEDTDGTVREISTPAIGIEFDGMSGVHKWYTEAELEAASSDGASRAPHGRARSAALRLTGWSA